MVAPEATRKELHYFDRFHSEAFTAADAAAYGEYFPRPQGLLTGEWSPSYLPSPRVPAMLAAAAPDARLLVLLRDPVERYISALQRHHRVALAGGQPLNAMAPLDAFTRGLYHTQLRRLLKPFPRAQVLILQYERCTSDPRSELRRTYEFLGVTDTGFVPPLDAHPNRQPDKPELHPDARGALIEAYAEDVALLIADYPELDVGLWPNFAEPEPSGRAHRFSSAPCSTRSRAPASRSARAMLWAPWPKRYSCTPGRPARRSACSRSAAQRVVEVDAVPGVAATCRANDGPQVVSRRGG